MSETELKILKMLEEGTITADEAAKLLNAVEREQAQATRDAIEDALPHGTAASSSPSTTPPLVRRFRLLFLGLFILSLVATAFCGYGTLAYYNNADRRITWGLFALLLALGLGLLFAGLLFWLWKARWLHIRIREEEGKRFMISLPIPFMLTEWGLRIARRFVDEQTAEYLEMGVSIVQTMRHSPRELDGEPISVQVGEGDQHVQVHIG